MMRVVGVVLAGGSGKRLWPLSRERAPKQVINIEGKPLIEHALKRIVPLIHNESCFVVTVNDYIPTLAQSVGDVRVSFVAEPCARNTGPAILLSAIHVALDDPEAVMLIAPADQLIAPQDIFEEDMHKMIAWASSSDDIVLCGIRPTHASSAYGYIESSYKSDQFFQVTRFYEKPEPNRAQEWFERGSFSWNSGIFCAKARVFIDAFRLHAPAMFDAVNRFCSGESGAYAQAPAISFDVAVLERCANLVMLKARFSWKDVGTLDTFLSLSEMQAQQVIQLNGMQNSACVRDKLVVFQGVSDLCVIETDEVLLIASRKEINAVGNIVDYVKKNGLERYV